MTVGIHPRMALSENFRLPFFTRSATASKLGLPNVPRDVAAVANLKALCVNVLEPVQSRLGRRLRVTSGFRTETLNRLMGGARDSQHLFGEAADFIVEGMATSDAAFTLAALTDLPIDCLASCTAKPDAAQRNATFMCRTGALVVTGGWWKPCSATWMACGWYRASRRQMQPWCRPPSNQEWRQCNPWYNLLAQTKAESKHARPSNQRRRLPEGCDQAGLDGHGHGRRAGREDPDDDGLP